MGMTYDALRERVVLFGGVSPSAYLAETWELDLSSASYDSIGSGCSGALGVPSLGAPVPPRLGQAFALEVRNVLPNAPVILYLGASDRFWWPVTLPLSLDQVGMNGCSLAISLEVVFHLSADSNGIATWPATPLLVPFDAQLLGARFYNQAFVRDSHANIAGFVLSNAARGTVGY
jgi:hypothetical protein